MARSTMIGRDVSTILFLSVRLSDTGQGGCWGSHRLLCCSLAQLFERLWLEADQRRTLRTKAVFILLHFGLFYSFHPLRAKRNGHPFLDSRLILYNVQIPAPQPSRKRTDQNDPAHHESFSWSVLAASANPVISCWASVPPALDMTPSSPSRPLALSRPRVCLALISSKSVIEHGVASSHISGSGQVAA